MQLRLGLEFQIDFLGGLSGHFALLLWKKMAGSTWDFFPMLSLGTYLCAVGIFESWLIFSQCKSRGHCMIHFIDGPVKYLLWSPFWRRLTQWFFLLQPCVCHSKSAMNASSGYPRGWANPRDSLSFGGAGPFVPCIPPVPSLR